MINSQVQNNSIDIITLIIQLAGYKYNVVYGEFQQKTFSKFVLLCKYLSQLKNIQVKHDLNTIVNLNQLVSLFENAILQLIVIQRETSEQNQNTTQLQKQVYQIVNYQIQATRQHLEELTKHVISVQDIIFISLTLLMDNRLYFLNNIITICLQLFPEVYNNDLFTNTLLNMVNKVNLIGKLIFDNQVQTINQFTQHQVYQKIVEKTQNWHHLQETPPVVSSVISIATHATIWKEMSNMILPQLQKQIKIHHKIHKYLNVFRNSIVFKSFTLKAKETVLTDLKRKVSSVHFNNVLSIFDIIQRVQMMQTQQFYSLFKFKNEQQVQSFLVNFQYGLQHDAVLSTEEQIYSTIIAYYLATFWQIKINLSQYDTKSFYLEKYVINKLFQSLESGLGYVQSYTDLLLIKRINDGKIFQFTSFNDETILNLLTQLQQYECDVVIVTKEKVNIQQLNIRNLSYQSICYNMELLLHFPLSLQKVSLHKTTIQNLCDCHNIVSIYSSENSYNRVDINSIHKLQVFVSYFDYYFGVDDTMIENIMNNNQMKIISIYDGKNILPKTLYNHLEYLQYFQLNGIYKQLIINVENSYPQNLTWIKSYTGPIKLDGDQFKENKLEQQLIKFYYELSKIELNNSIIKSNITFSTKNQQHQNSSKYILIDLFKNLLWNELLNSQNNPPRYYNICCALQQIKDKSSEQLINEFKIASISDAESLVQQFGNKKIRSVPAWKQMLCWSHYIKRSYIRFLFNHRDNELDFYFNDISKADWKELLEDIDNKILGVDSNYACIVSRNINTDEIIKNYTTVNQKDAIPDVISQIKELPGMYDLILINYKIIDIQLLKLRYLSYYNNTGQNIDLYLEYPQFLISVALSRVNIANLGECLQLKNLCSSNNIYHEYNLINLTTLKMLYSENDVCLSQENNQPTSMIKILTQVAKLQYIYVNIGSQQSFPLHINTNLSDLYFFYHYSKPPTEIVFNILTQFPANLQILSAQYLAQDREHVDEGQIQVIGDPNAVSKLKKQVKQRLNK